MKRFYSMGDNTELRDKLARIWMAHWPPPQRKAWESRVGWLVGFFKKNQKKYCSLNQQNTSTTSVDVIEKPAFVYRPAMDIAKVT